MDCRTARYLLSFTRPRGDDLDAEDRSALSTHLSNCEECDAAARAERQLDEHLGKAIRDVPIPAGLKDRLLGRLRQQRDEWWKAGLQRAGRYVAVAAAIMIAVWARFYWKSQDLPRPNSEDFVSVVLSPYHGSPPDKSDAESFFRKMGHPVALPEGFNYDYLTAYGFTQIDGNEVPYIRFVRSSPGSSSAQFAEVFILTKKKFNLADMQPTRDPGGYRVRVEILRPSADLAHVVIYTGNFNDLMDQGPDL